MIKISNLDYNKFINNISQYLTNYIYSNISNKNLFLYQVNFPLQKEDKFDIDNICAVTIQLHKNHSIKVSGYTYDDQKKIDSYGIFLNIVIPYSLQPIHKEQLKFKITSTISHQIGHLRQYDSDLKDEYKHDFYQSRQSTGNFKQNPTIYSWREFINNYMYLSQQLDAQAFKIITLYKGRHLKIDQSALKNIFNHTKNTQFTNISEILKAQIQQSTSNSYNPQLIKQYQEKLNYADKITTDYANKLIQKIKWLINNDMKVKLSCKNWYKIILAELKY